MTQTIWAGALHILLATVMLTGLAIGHNHVMRHHRTHSIILLLHMSTLALHRRTHRRAS